MYISNLDLDYNKREVTYSPQTFFLVNIFGMKQIL